MKLKFRLKFNHGFTNHDYLHSAAWKDLYNFKINRAQDARRNQFFFQNVRNNEIFETFKMFKTTVELTLTTQKAHACSPFCCVVLCWAGFFVFDWKYLFFFFLVQKLDIISLSWYFVPRLIQISRIPWWCSLFLFLTGSACLGKFSQKIKIVNFSRNFALD